MQEFYEKSLRKIKKLPTVLTNKEWNKLAYEQGYLSTESLEYISGMRYEVLCKSLRAST